MGSKKIFGIFVLGIFLIGMVSAMSVTFYHSDKCPYCQQIKPIFMEQINKYPSYQFGVYEITSNKENYDAFIEDEFEGVPAFKIKTDDCREIKFTGANLKKLNCELQQMSTKECPTYSAEIKKEGSLFLR